MHKELVVENEENQHEAFLEVLLWAFSTFLIGLGFWLVHPINNLHLKG